MCRYKALCGGGYDWKVSRLEWDEQEVKIRRDSLKQSLILSKTLLEYVGIHNPSLFCTNTNTGFPCFPKVHFCKRPAFLPAFTNPKERRREFSLLRYGGCLFMLFQLMNAFIGALYSQREGKPCRF